MAEYEITHKEVNVILASKLSKSRKDSFDYTLREKEKGWIIDYDHLNADEGLVKSVQLWLPNEVVDALIAAHAKKKLTNEQ